MKRFNIFAIAVVVFSVFVSRAEENIVFAGDIIASNGEFRAIAQVYAALRDPSRKLYLLNAGIVGDTAADGLKRLEWDVLRHKPSKVFLMFGLSDVRKNIRYSKSGSIIGKRPPVIRFAACQFQFEISADGLHFVTIEMNRLGA